MFCLFQKWTNIVFTHFFTEKFSSTLLYFFLSKEKSRVSELPTFPTRDQPEFSICERTSGNRRPCPFCLVPWAARVIWTLSALSSSPFCSRGSRSSPPSSAEWASRSRRRPSPPPWWSWRSPAPGWFPSGCTAGSLRGRAVRGVRGSGKG